MSKYRQISLVRWNMIGTYSGVLEGSKKTASRYFRKNIQQRASRLLDPSRPLAIIDSHEVELPNWFCVAELESSSGVHTNNSDFNSRLYVCWFMDNTDKSLDEIIESIIPQIDWDGLAENYDIMDF